MGINITNFLSSQSKNLKMNEFQDLEHIDGISISTVSANLYNNKRDDLVMFYFREVQILPLFTLNLKLSRKILSGI